MMPKALAVYLMIMAVLIVAVFCSMIVSSVNVQTDSEGHALQTRDNELYISLGEYLMQSLGVLFLLTVIPIWVCTIGQWLHRRDPEAPHREETVAFVQSLAEREGDEEMARLMRRME